MLLVGDTELLPGYQSLSYTDNYFATLEGDDYLADIMVGRFSVDTVLECETMVAKTLGYERTPLEDDPNWPASGLLIVFNDCDVGDLIYYGNTWFIYDLMEDAGVAPIDTLFQRNNPQYDDFFASMNAGKGFVNYRGQAWQYWIQPFNVPAEYFDNGWRQPVVVSATCGTGIYQADEFMGENWTRGGTPEDPKGCVAYFSTDTGHDASEKWSLRRGYVDEGFFANAFGEDGWLLGEACLAGKLNLYEISPDTSEYEGWNLLGDPELNLWSGPPGHLTVLHDEGVQIGQPDLPVTVLLGGEAVEGALVACIGDTDLYVWGYTGPTGYVSLPLNVAAPGSLSITVTARNGYPYEGSAYVLESGPFVVFSEYALDDASGNGDGFLAPGESVELALALSNIGDGLAESGETVGLVLDVENQGGRDALGVSVSLATNETVVSVVDGTAGLPDIPMGGSGQNSDPLVLSISEAIDDTVATVWAAFEANGGVYTTTARVDLHIDLSATGVPDRPPTAFGLSACHPNPFARGTTMRLALPTACPVTARVCSPAGRSVRALVDAPMPVGEHAIRWDGADGSGRRVASGVYFVRVEAGGSGSGGRSCFCSRTHRSRDGTRAAVHAAPATRTHRASQPLNER